MNECGYFFLVFLMLHTVLTDKVAYAEVGGKVDTTAQLSKVVFESIKDEDKDAFRELFIGEMDIEHIFISSGKDLKDPSELKKAKRYLNRVEKKVSKAWLKLLKTMAHAGVDPKSLAFDDALEVRCEEEYKRGRRVLSCDRILMFAKSSLGRVAFEIDDPIKIKRRWVIGDKVEFLGVRPKTTEDMLSFKKGERVGVISGPYKDYKGVVTQVHHMKRKVTVVLTIYGREAAPVELEYKELTK